MPIYEYTCDQCRQECELLIRGDQSPQCPCCGSEKLQKLLSVPAAHVSSGGELPICQPQSSQGCGLPQCGMGGCQMP